MSLGDRLLLALIVPLGTAIATRVALALWWPA